MNDEIEISCPYCGEMNVVEVDITERQSQTFIQDCSVCCRPVEFKINIDRDGNINVETMNDEGF